MKHDSADLDEPEEHQKECEAVRTALADALLRSERTRGVQRVALSSLEEQWVSDVARMLVGEVVGGEIDSDTPESRGKRLLRDARSAFARLFGRYRQEAVVRDVSEKEFEYHPVACGAQGAVHSMSNGEHAGKLDAAPITNGAQVK